MELRKLTTRSLILGIAATPLPSFAQMQLEEIIVTAQRKTESMQDVPIAVNAFTGDKLSSMGVTDTYSLEQAVPSLVYATDGPSATPFLRGIGSTGANPNDEPSVATYVDGVYIASPAAIQMQLNNIERIEVLKGPQGTLFGRNATAGVIQIITRDPSYDPVLEVSAGVANYDTTSGGIYASMGITDTLAIDIAGQFESQDKGWGTMYGPLFPADGVEIRESGSSSVRTKVLWEPNEQFTAKLSADYSENETSQLIYTGAQGQLSVIGELPPSDPYDAIGGISYKGIGVPITVIRQSGAALNLSYDASALRFVSISAYRETHNNYKPEADLSVAPIVEGDLPAYVYQISQEFQVMSNNDSWLDWVLGAYYFEGRAGYDTEFAGLAFAVPAFSDYGYFFFDAAQTSESKAIYAQGTTEIMADTNLTVGLRYTDETQSLDGDLAVAGLPDNPIYIDASSTSDRGFEEPTWRVALDHSFTEDVLGYVSYNRGVKGGGFNLLVPFDPGFDPEQVDAYEIGLKTELLGNTLRLNGAIFYYDFQDIQVQQTTTGGGGTVIKTNAGAATIQGIDVDFEYLVTDSFTISGGFAILDGEFDEYKNAAVFSASPLDGPPPGADCIGGSCFIDASGNDTIRTPDFTGTLTADYRVMTDMGEIPFTLSINHNSGFYWGPDERQEQESYTLINATVGWNSLDDKYSVTLWGRNLTDKLYWEQGVPSGLGDLYSPASPRTYGLGLKAKF